MFGRARYPADRPSEQTMIGASPSPSLAPKRFGEADIVDVTLSKRYQWEAGCVMPKVVRGQT
jgi:hypothetical protein